MGGRVHRADPGAREGTARDVDRCRRDIEAVVREIDGVAASDVREANEGTVGTSRVPEEYDRNVFELAGLDCRVCAGLIEAALMRLAGVSNATASHLQGTLRVDYDPEAIAETDLRSELLELGYPIETTDEAFANRRATQWAEARFAGGVLAGAMVLALYAAVIYPTRFDNWFYHPEVVALLERALASVAATHFYLNIAVLTGFVLFFTGKPVLDDAATAVVERSPNGSLAIATLAMALYAYSSLTAFWLVVDGGVYYDVVLALIVGTTIVRQSEVGVSEAASDDSIDPADAGETTATVTERDRR